MTDEEKAEAVVDGLGSALVTINGQSLSGKQVDLVLKRVQKQFQSAHSISFHRAYFRAACCDIDQWEVQYFPAPIEGFNARKKPTGKMRFCPNCGELSSS
jgi:hypothetical protein